MTSRETQVAQQDQSTGTLDPAPWSARVLAYVIDQLYGGLLALSVLTLALTMGLVIDPWLGVGIAAFGYVATFAVSMWQLVLVQGRTGYTVGKRFVGIQLVDEGTEAPPGAGVAFLRSLLHIVDALPLFLGFLWPLGDKKRQTFADKFVHTLVVRRSREEAGPNAYAPIAISLGVVAALLACACVGLVVRDRDVQQGSDLEKAQGAALSAARQAIKNLDSLSADTVDADLKRIVAGATGSFKEQFVKAQAQLKEVVIQRKTVSTATILAAGIERSDDDSATVLVAVDRSVKDTTTPDGVLAHDRWKLTMEKHGGRWLVATLDPVS